MSWNLLPILAALDKVPWLSRLGDAIERDESMPPFALPPWAGETDPWLTPIEPEALDVERLTSFDAWKGPEDPASEALSGATNVSYQALVTEAGWLKRRKRAAAYERVRAHVIELAGKRVPYEAARDPWFAPNAAVWSAGTIAGLMAVYRLIGHWPDTVIEEQWQWFRRGHWPAAYTSEDGEFLVIY